MSGIKSAGTMIMKKKTIFKTSVTKGNIRWVPEFRSRRQVKKSNMNIDVNEYL